MAKVNSGWALLCLFLMSCFSRTPMMTQGNYEAVLMGEPFTTIQKQNGTPYAIHSAGYGATEYEYIERIEMGNRLVAENHYFILVENGKVVGKHMKQELPPAYNLIYQPEPNYRSFP
jgi:hypothetical protein